MHSQAYKCFVNGPLSVNRDDCVNTRHQHDLMGLRHAATRVNGHFKDHFGWMPEANKTTIHSDGCHVIDLHDLAQPADPGQTQFVEISLPHDVPAGTAGGSEIDFDVVTLEFRGHTGFDRRSFKLVPLADGGFRDVTAEVNAFLPDFWDPIDGYLLEGETWEVPGNPMKITVDPCLLQPAEFRTQGRAGPVRRYFAGKRPGSAVTETTHSAQNEGESTG